MTSSDYPIIRLVPSSLRRDEDEVHGQMMDLLVYYGEESHEFEEGGIQAQYEWLMDTVLDEDRLPGYKLFCSRFEVR